MAYKYTKTIKLITIGLLLLAVNSCGVPRRSFFVQRTHYYSSYDIEQVGQYEQPCSDHPTFIDPRDSTVYNTIQIGDQCWMKENLKWLPEVSDLRKVSHIEPNYFVYGYKWSSDVARAKETDSYKHYGVLYNWPAALTACPPGWRLPGVDDWKEMQSYLVNHYEEVNHVNIGTVLRSCRQRRSDLGGKCDTRTHPYWSPSSSFVGTDDFGFSALPGGYKKKGPSFSSKGAAGYWWTFDAITPIHATAIGLADSNLEVGMGDKSESISIRCIKKDKTKPQAPQKTYKIDTIAYKEWADELRDINRKTNTYNFNLITFLSHGVANPGLSIATTIFIVGGPTAAGLASAGIGLSALYASIKISIHRERIRRNHFIKLEEESWIKEVNP